MSQSRPLIAREESAPPYYVGVDLGGTNIKIGLLDERGNSLAYLSIPTDVEEGPEDGSRRMGEGVHAVIRQAGVQVSEVARVGLATPGSMDIPQGLLIHPHNLPGWFDFPIRDRVSHHAKLPVTYANDANAAAYGEFWRGSGEQFHSMVLLTLGTGVGGGIIIGDLLVEGEHSAGGEVGHIIIDSRDDARLCGCGQRGHLEAYASATGVIGRTTDALDAGHRSSLAALIEAGHELTPRLIAREATAGDALSREIVLETARYLGIGIVTLINTIDPAGVVLGGAMNFGGPDHPLGRQFIDRVRTEVRERALTEALAEVTVAFATLGSDAGYIGAAGLARLDHHKPRTA